MSISPLPELPQFCVVGGQYDIFSCYSAAGIASGLLVMLDTLNRLDVDLDVLGNPLLGPGVALPSAGTPPTTTFGWTRGPIAIAGYGGVQAGGGVVPCTARGTVNVGDLISASSTAAKLGWAQSAVAGDIVIGQAVSYATDGNTVLVKLQPPTVHA